MCTAVCMEFWLGGGESIAAEEQKADSEMENHIVHYYENKLNWIFLPFFCVVFLVSEHDERDGMDKIYITISRIEIENETW